MNEELRKYAEVLGANIEILSWLDTTGKKHIKKQEDGEHIIDFLVSPAAPTRLQKMSFKDAKRKAKEWSDASQKKGKNLTDSDDDIETIHDFLDGTRIVRLKTKNAYQREGFLMCHCSGGYIPKADQLIYSYRDKQNMPHATFEVQKKDNQIVQIKGKGNGAIHPKYIHPILAFLKAVGMEIRPHDMKNLGYFHIHETHIEFLKQSPAAMKQVVMISGEAYAY